MIVNIVDSREKSYLWKAIDAVIEPAWHDNSIGGDQALVVNGPLYEDYRDIAISEIVDRANRLPYEVTVYLYDKGFLDK